MGSWVWRVMGREALHLSEEWYRIYGFDPEDGIPTWEQRLQRIHPEDRAKWQGAIDRAIDEKGDYEVEVRILLPDGTVKYLHTVGHPVLNASGELMQFVGSSMEICRCQRTEDELPAVMGDRVQLQQVLMNLMINGMDAMKDVDRARELAVKSQKAENEQVLVCVSDTGVGLPVQQADQIFKAFFTTKPQGTGMGLSISRSIIETHGGRLWATDHSPCGASFCFSLPTKAEASE